MLLAEARSCLDVDADDAFLLMFLDFFERPSLVEADAEASWEDSAALGSRDLLLLLEIDLLLLWLESFVVSVATGVFWTCWLVPEREPEAEAGEAPTCFILIFSASLP